MTDVIDREAVGLEPQAEGMERTMNITAGLLLIVAYVVAALLVNFAGKAEDRHPPPHDVPARPDRSSDRDMIQPIE